MTRFVRAGATVVLLSAFVSPALAGVTNPQISIVGQPTMSWNDDPDNPNHERMTLDPGETELVFDDYLNPYARGFFTLSLGEAGMELEEGFFTLFRGLPLDVAVKGGQYRVPFGRLNQAHPHANPFAEPFEILHAYLPGDEAYIEPGIDLSRRFPIVGDFSLNAQVDWLQGNSLRIERESSGDPADPLESGGDDGIDQARPAFVARLTGFTMVGERSALEFGMSAGTGTNNVAAAARTTLYGIEAKAKLWASQQAYLVLQGEGFAMKRDVAGWEPETGYIRTSVKPVGGYLFADYNFGIRYSLGGGYEHFEEPLPGKPITESLDLWGGYSLLEETTAFRLDWRHIIPEIGDAFNTLTLRVIYSMGPHKAHQF